LLYLSPKQRHRKCAIYRGEGGAGDATADASNAAALADSFADAANASAGQAATSASAALAAQTAAEAAQTAAELAETNAETAEANAEAVLTDAGFIVVAADLQGTDTIGTVATDIANVNAVGNNIANVNTVAGISADVTAVAGDATDIGIVATSIADVNDVADNIADVTAVADNETNIDTVAANNANITTVAGISGNVTTVAGISANVTTVAGVSANVTTVATDIANVNSVATNIANVNAVNSNATNINTVAGISANVTTVAGISGNVTTVATNNANVTTVAGSIANVNTNATNIANINQNAANIVAIQNASANATAAASSATAAAGSATSASASAAAASAVALGNEPVRHSVRPSLLLDFANTKTLDPRITFTRASTATYYDGKTVAKAEENLFTFSEQFDNGIWTKTRLTTTTNSTTAPDGTTTAETVTANTENNLHLIRQSLSSVPSVSFAFSVYVKANGYTKVSISDVTQGTVSVQYDLTLGTVISSSGANYISSSISNAGNGWYRCSVVYSFATSIGYSMGVIGYPDSGTTISNFGASYTGDDTNGIFAWGAQLEQRSSVTAYTATTTAPITNYIPALQTAASGVARFEHNPITGESLGLEIEEQRTNLLTYSDDLSNAIWATKDNVTIQSNVIIAPDGTLTADKLVEDTSTNAHRVYRTISGASRTFSFYAKAAERSWVVVLSDVGPYTFFNLASGVVGTVASGSTASIQAVGNGWYRCTVSSTHTSFGAFIGLATDGSTVSYTGNGWNGVYIWGAQLEAGAFATSYIPTTTAQVTRSADSASMTGSNFSSWYRADEGTVYSEASYLSASGQNYIGTFNNAGSLSNLIGFGRHAAGSSTTGYDCFVVANGANQSFASVAGLTAANTFYKTISAFKTNDFANVANGGTAGVDSLGLIPVVSQLIIGAYGNAAGVLNGTLKKLAYYPRRLTNAELQGLTTV
jgi:hypothetical protein